MNARDALIELQGIRSDFEKNKINYGLIESEIKDTKAVINTLEYILTALIDNTPLKCCLSFYSDKETKIEVPIHFENYALKDNVNEMMSEKSKQLLFGSLIIKFIECYQEMKKKNKMKAFCSRLEGNCIDARTRGAFDFVLTNQDPPPFTDLLRVNMQELPTDHKDLYFFAFAQILKNSWDKPFIADKQEKGLCKKKGVINTDQFELIKSSLEMLGFEPSNDFLMAYNMLKDEKHQHLLPIYMKFVLSHQNILDEMGLNKQGVEKENKENNTATPVVRSLYNKMVIDLIPIMSKTIQNNPKNYGLDANEFKLFIDFLERTSPATCFSILSFVPIHDLHPERIKIYTNLLYQKLMWSKDQHVDEYKKFLKTKFGRKFDLHGLLEKYNPEKAPAIQELMFEEEHKEATFPHQYDGEEQFRQAVDPRHSNVVRATQLIAEKKIDRQKANEILIPIMASFANQEVPDEIYQAYCDLLAYTFETPDVNPATKEVILFDSSIEHLSADMRLYFFALVEIMKNNWGDQINLNGKKISVNSDQLPLLIEYLTKKGYQPQNDFLTAHEGLKKNHEHLLPFYLKLVSSHKGLLDAEGFTRLGIDTPEQEQKYAKIASPVERLCYNNMIKNLLIPAIKKANSEKSKRTDLNAQDFELLADLLVRATPGTCFDILSLISIDTRPKEKQENLLKLLYKKFEYYLKANPESAADLLTIRFGEKKYTLLDLTSVCNFPTIFKIITDKVPNYMSIDGCLNVPPPHVGLLTAARAAMYQRAAAKADKPAPNVVNDGNQRRPFP